MKGTESRQIWLTPTFSLVNKIKSHIQSIHLFLGKQVQHPQVSQLKGLSPLQFSNAGVSSHRYLFPKQDFTIPTLFPMNRMGTPTFPGE